MMRQYLDPDLEHRETTHAMVCRGGRHRRKTKFQMQAFAASFWVLLLHLFKLFLSQEIGNCV